MEVVELEDEGEIYETIEDVWPDYPDMEGCASCARQRFRNVNFIIYYDCVKLRLQVTLQSQFFIAQPLKILRKSVVVKTIPIFVKTISNLI